MIGIIVSSLIWLAIFIEILPLKQYNENTIKKTTKITNDNNTWNQQLIQHTQNKVQIQQNDKNHNDQTITILTTLTTTTTQTQTTTTLPTSILTSSLPSDHDQLPDIFQPSPSFPSSSWPCLSCSPFPFSIPLNSEPLNFPLSTDDFIVGIYTWNQRHKFIETPLKTWMSHTHRRIVVSDRPVNPHTETELFKQKLLGYQTITPFPYRKSKYNYSQGTEQEHYNTTQQSLLWIESDREIELKEDRKFGCYNRKLAGGKPHVHLLCAVYCSLDCLDCRLVCFTVFASILIVLSYLLMYLLF